MAEAENVEVSARAAVANAAQQWDQIWGTGRQQDWRPERMDKVYKRIAKLLPKGNKVIDLGGGRGDLAKLLRDEGHEDVEVWDHSSVGLRTATKAGFVTRLVDLEVELPSWPEEAWIVGTEVLEHLTEAARRRILTQTKHGFFSVPNNILGPEEEAQHTRKWTALEFLTELRSYRPSRVEVPILDPEGGGPYLLGCLGFEKSYKLSVTFPARNEAIDIERTLASFRGAADELVIGIDPRSADATETIARCYAETVFMLESPEGRDAEDRAPDGGVHFADIRNQCLEKCSGAWIFMTEAHERLGSGLDVLLQLDRVLPTGVKLCFVLRTGQGQRWAFPWLIRNDPEIRYKRKTHNVVDYPVHSPAVRMSQISTVHERSHENALARKKQRGIQNRKTLFEDWIVNGNEQALYYFSSELRDFDRTKAVERLEQLLAMPSKMGAMRYQARLVLAKEYMIRKEFDEAKRVLLGCTGEDWSRGEHWMWLGDIAFDQEQFEEALQWYLYLTPMINKPPWTVWWINLYAYGHLAAQRLAMTYATLNYGPEALEWARKVLELLPEDAPEGAREECMRNINQLEEALGEAKTPFDEINEVEKEGKEEESTCDTQMSTQ